MKFIIKESRLTEVIFKYLEGLKLSVVEIGPVFYISIKTEVESGQFIYEPIIKIEKEPYLSVVSKKNYRGIAYVDRELKNEIETMFSLDRSQFRDIIVEFIKNKLNIEIDDVKYRVQV